MFDTPTYEIESIFFNHPVVFLIDSLYAETTETATSRAASSASIDDRIWIYDFVGDSLKQLPVCKFSSGTKTSLVL
jgi:hypothetical protein